MEPRSIHTRWWLGYVRFTRRKGAPPAAIRLLIKRENSSLGKIGFSTLLQYRSGRKLLHDRSGYRGRLEIPINRSCPRNRICSRMKVNRVCLHERKKKKERKKTLNHTGELERCSKTGKQLGQDWLWKCFTKHFLKSVSRQLKFTICPIHETPLFISASIYPENPPPNFSTGR